jgi:hypothetical protein
MVGFPRPLRLSICEAGIKILVKPELSKALDAVELLGEQIAHDADHRSGAQLDVGGNGHAALQIEALIACLHDLLLERDCGWEAILG